MSIVLRAPWKTHHPGDALYHAGDTDSKYPGHASKLATLKPYQKLENLYFNILTTT